MSIKLNNDMYTLLNEVVKKHCPWNMHLISKRDEINLDYSQIMEFCNVAADELCDSGLQDNDEPNERGYLLEELNDRLLQEAKSTPEWNR